MAIQRIVGQGVTHNRIFLRKCARWSRMRLAQLDAEIQHRKALSHLDAACAEQEAPAIAKLDAERVDRLRHQGDLPGVGRLISHSAPFFSGL